MMAKWEQKSILDLPDEILEDYVMPSLSHNDLVSLIKVGERRLRDCSKKTIAKRRFCKYFLKCIGKNVIRDINKFELFCNHFLSINIFQASRSSEDMMVDM